MDKHTSAKPARFQANLNSLATLFFALLIVVMVNYFSYRHYHRADYSQNRYYQLSDKTIQLLKNLPEPVTITLFLSSSDLKVEIETLLTEYKYHAGDKIHIQRVDPDLDYERAEALVKRLNLGKDENLVVFEYKDRSKYLNDYQLADYDNSMTMMGGAPKLKAFKGEQQFTATIKALVEGKPSKVYYLTGHGERDITNSSGPGGFGQIDLRIKRENIETATLNLAEQPEIPQDADALIIAGPKAPFSAGEAQAINKYLDDKGKVILLQDPQTTSGLEPVLAQYGMQLDNDLIVGRIPIAAGQTMLVANAFGTDFAKHPAVAAMEGYNLNVTSARSISILKQTDGTASPKVMELVKTPAGFWGETNLTDNKPVFDPAVDKAGPLCVAALYDGGEIPGEGVNVTGTRLLVVGSSSFLSNGALSGLSVDFLTNAMDWMLKKEIGVGIGPKIPQEFPLKLSPLQSRAVTIFSLGFVPGLALVAGVMLWARRRR